MIKLTANAKASYSTTLSMQWYIKTRTLAMVGSCEIHLRKYSNTKLTDLPQYPT